MVINTKSCLDELTNAEQLIPGLEILRLLSTTFPDAFSAHFAECIDFLMGWRIEDNLSEPVAEAIMGMSTGEKLKVTP